MVWLWLSRNFVCPWALGVSGFTGIWRVAGKDGEGDSPSSGAGTPDAEDVIFPSHRGPSTCPTQESSFFFFLLSFNSYSVSVLGVTGTVLGFVTEKLQDFQKLLILSFSCII